MAKITKTLTKEQTGRLSIGEFLSAMNYHDDDLQNTIKFMRKKLIQIQKRESAAGGAAVMIKEPPTIRKIIFKFGGSATCLPIVHHKRQHSETLVSDAIETPSTSTHSKTLILKRKKIKNNNGDDKDDGALVLKDSRTVFPVNPNFHEAIFNNNSEGEGVNVMDFIKNMGGSEAELMIEKRLTTSDVTDNQGRLLIPLSKVNNQGFLTTDEKMLLGNKQDISVCVFDPKRRKLMLNLAKWKMSREYYVLKTNWNQVVRINGLKEDMVIKVLSFRVHEKLCFALDRVA